MPNLSTITAQRRELRKSADRMEAQLAELELQAADTDRRLSIIEAEDEGRQSFPEATAMALAVATWHQAPRMVQ
jgi:hypothetical protein